MKAILFAAAALMTGASVYGLIDYNKRSVSGELENLYRKDNAASPGDVLPATVPVAREKDVKAVVADDNVKMAVKEEKPAGKVVKKKRKISYKTFSRAEPNVKLAD